MLFAPFLAAAFGVDLESFMRVLGIASLASLVNGFLSPALDVFDPSRVFLFAEVLIILGILTGFMHGLTAAGMMFFLFWMGCGQTQPSIQVPLRLLVFHSFSP